MILASNFEWINVLSSINFIYREYHKNIRENDPRYEVLVVGIVFWKYKNLNFSN